MARILFIVQFYPPETGAAARRVSDIATQLVGLGHEVTVLTTLPNYPLGVVPPEYQRKQRREEMINGVRVVRVWSVIRPNKGFLSRIIAQLSFGLAAGRLGARRVGKPDVVITVSPPLFTSFAGRRLSRKKQSPLVFNVADLWPESAVQLGALRNPLFIWLAERLEWSTYRRARTVWVVTPGQRDTLLRRGLPERKILMLPSGVNTRTFGQIQRDVARAALGWDNGYYVLHAGTIGLTMSSESFVEAAELLRNHTDIRVVFAGDGAERAHLEAEIKQRGLTNVLFLGVQPLDRIPTLLAAADSCLVYPRKLKFFGGSLPVRMYEAMASGRPLLLAMDGIARTVAIDEARAGLYVEPENAQALAREILRLYESPELARQLGTQGRAYTDAHLDRDKMIEALHQHLTALAAEKSGRRQVAHLSAPVASTQK